MKATVKKKYSGFTLIELMIVIIVVGILAGVAIPSYTLSMKKSYYSELVNSITPYQKSVALCFQLNETLTDCSGGSNSIPANLTNSSDDTLVSAVDVTDGIITATPKTANGIVAADTLTFTPSGATGSLVWTITGGSSNACTYSGLCSTVIVSLSESEIAAVAALSASPASITDESKMEVTIGDIRAAFEPLFQTAAITQWLADNNLTETDLTNLPDNAIINVSLSVIASEEVQAILAP